MHPLSPPDSARKPTITPMGSDRDLSTPVLIAGGGPVGLTLAMDLAWRGVDVVVVEERPRDTTRDVKCNHISAKSMEVFRRLGVASKLRNAGLPADYPADVSYRTSFTGRELTRIPIPSRHDRYVSTEGPDTGWPTPEPPHRINQRYIEPILFDHASQMRHLRILDSTRLVSHRQDDQRVVATVADVSDGTEYTIEAEFLVGCEGGRSATRRAIGATLLGDAVIQRVQSTHIRAPELIDLQNVGRSWATFTLGAARSGNVYAIDGLETWLVHNYLRDDEPEFDSVDRDWAIRAILGVDDDFSYEVLTEMDWYGRRFVADRFRDRRVFICGDAAHVWVPYGGYGMNAGIADAANLSWPLAAHLNGWAPMSILDAHERERQPITEQVSHFAMEHSARMAGQRSSVPPNIDDDGPEGEQARRRLGAEAYELNVQQYCCGGLNFGYYYDDSPIIVHDGAAPGYSMSEFTPSTVPGCRTPHVRLSDGRSLYDRLGPEFSLLRTDPTLDVRPFEVAAHAAGVPLAVVDLEGAEADQVYDHPLVLSRPDQHIAWRGHSVPDDATAIVDRVRGAG
jgi:2-polyprenyl-6-methoxyphenol hydroxylase-like FAD-dependent oxidoreductase